MCGIAGVLYSEPRLNNDDFLSLMRSMGDTLKHRGPDDHGEWVDVDAGIGFAHRRLSILDLSPAGHQPMISRNKRYVIIFNGEIYNYREIKADLEKSGVVFRGHSDTETLLESIVHKGLEKTLDLINGMFAFALWDKETRMLTLVRDRIGKKPLYYGWCNGVFLFASELKALKLHPSFNDEIDRAALGQFIQYSWLNGPASIYLDIKKLQPGSYIKVTQTSTASEVQPNIYWSSINQARQAQANLYAGSYDDSVNELEGLLCSAVQKRMIADVDLGALLSGGIDSSLIVSMMQSNSQEKIKTFSIGFHEETHNEAEHAKLIAEYLGTDHQELYVTAQDCMDVIPQLPLIYDEPFADVSQIPTYLVSKLASQKVKVVLSGDGGDELFAGYTRYFRCLQHWQKHSNIPVSVRPAIGISMDAMAKSLWYALGRTRVKQGVSGWRRLGAKLEKRARRISASTPLELFIRMMSRYKNINEIVIGYSMSNTFLTKSSLWPNFPDEILNMMLTDTSCYLPDDILVKVDRATMAVGLEARSPLLDKCVAEFSWGLPMSSKVNEFGGKKILKDVLARYIPASMTDRKKMGFGVPIGAWLRGPLNHWANDLLSQDLDEEFLNNKVVNRLWLQHQSGWRNHDDILWAILMFKSWRKASK